MDCMGGFGGRDMGRMGGKHHSSSQSDCLKDINRIMCISVGLSVSNQPHFRNLPGTLFIFSIFFRKKTNRDESQNVTLEHKTSHKCHIFRN